MSKHENTQTIFDKAAHVRPEKFESIAAVFAAWTLAHDCSLDRTQSPQAKAEASLIMEHLWDAAMTFTSRSAADGAAIYIMAENTPSIDPVSYLETAWRIAATATAAASGEAELVGLHATWCEVHGAPVTYDMDDAQGDHFYRIAAQIEEKIAAIPATTARGLAIKVDLFGRLVPTHLGRISLDRDLAKLTGQAERPQ